MEIFLERNFINNLPPTILFPRHPRESGDPEKRTRSKWLDPPSFRLRQNKKESHSRITEKPVPDFPLTKTNSPLPCPSLEKYVERWPRG